MNSAAKTLGLIASTLLVGGGVGAGVALLSTSTPSSMEVLQVPAQSVPSLRYEVGMSCEQMAQSDILASLPGWSIKCQRGNLSNGGPQKRRIGLTNYAERTITLSDLNPVLPTQDQPYSQTGSLAHEFAHAWASQHLSDQQKKSFAQQVSKEDFQDTDDYRSNPEEIWARTWQACVGWHTSYPETVQPCSTLTQYGVPQELLQRFTRGAH